MRQLASQISLFPTRNIVIRPVIKRRAGFTQAPTFNLYIIAVSVRDEGKRVDVPRFKIHWMDVFTARAEHDACDFAPDRRHCAHAARLKRGIEGTTPQVGFADAGTRFSDCHHFGMGSCIMQFITLIAFCSDQPVIKNYDGTNG